MRAHRQCVHRCSQGAQCGRTRCRARTQSAGPRHCNTTVPATQAATLQRDTQQRMQQTHQAAHAPSAITPQHLRCLPFELSTEQRGSRRKLRGLDDVRHIAHAVSPGAHRRRTVSWRAGLTPRALRANPACMRPLPRAHCSARLLDNWNARYVRTRQLGGVRAAGGDKGGGGAGRRGRAPDRAQWLQGWLTFALGPPRVVRRARTSWRSYHAPIMR